MNLSGDDAALSDVKCELAREALRSSGALHLLVTGRSMLPTIWPGDTLVIESADRDRLCRGDIVLFRRHQRLFAHRMIAENDDAILTQGDGVPVPDAAVQSSELLGRVCFILRGDTRFEPRRTLRFSERIVAALVRRFYWAARILIKLHAMRHLEPIAPCLN